MNRYHLQVARINSTSFAHQALLLIAVIAGSAVAQAMADAHAATRSSDRLTAEAVNVKLGVNFLRRPVQLVRKWWASGLGVITQRWRTKGVGTEV